jgi:hypothetical protein
LVPVAVAFHWEQHMDLVLVEVLQLARMQLLLHKYLRSSLVKLAVACSAFSYLQTVTAQLPLMVAGDVRGRVMDLDTHSPIALVLGVDALLFVYLDLQLIW